MVRQFIIERQADGSFAVILDGVWFGSRATFDEALTYANDIRKKKDLGPIEVPVGETRWINC